MSCSHSLIIAEVFHDAPESKMHSSLAKAICRFTRGLRPFLHSKTSASQNVCCFFPLPPIPPFLAESRDLIKGETDEVACVELTPTPKRLKTNVCNGGSRERAEEDQSRGNTFGTENGREANWSASKVLLLHVVRGDSMSESSRMESDSLCTAK